MVQQKLTSRLHACILHKIVKVFSITQLTQSCVAHRRPVPPGQPDHMPTRGPVSQDVPSTQHEQPFSMYAERTTFGSQCADKTRWLAPRHIARKQQCFARVRMSAPECRTSTDARTVRVVLCNTAGRIPVILPQFQVIGVPTVYVPLSRTSAAVVSRPS